MANPTYLLADDEYADLAASVPGPDEPFLKKYLAGRDALVAQEDRLRSDHAFRASLSPMGRRADEIVKRIRAEEQASIWSAQGPVGEVVAAASRSGDGANLADRPLHRGDSTHDITTHPGMMFAAARSRIPSTKLWRIVRRLPKGALLHAHGDAMLDAHWLVERVLSERGMCLVADRALVDEEACRDAEVRFRYGGGKAEREGGSAGSTTASSIWTADYEPHQPVPAGIAAETFPEGGRAGFLQWIKDKCNITMTDSLKYHHGPAHIWHKFSSVFPILQSMVYYEPIWRQYLRQLFAQLLDDGVRWAELRLAFASPYYRSGQTSPAKDYTELFQAFDQELRAFQASEAGKGFWGATIIWTSLRFLPQRPVVEDMDACLSMKLAFPDIISGYDLVAREDDGRPLTDLLPELFWFRKQCAQEGVEIPFFFHAGETLHHGTQADQNLFDAVLLGTRRIGHGFSLYKHPLLIDMVKEKRILIESCPISNEVLRYCSSILSHPLPALLARGVPCSLSSDDPGVLGHDAPGVSYDFWQALQGWDNLGLAGLGSLAENSVRWSAFTSENAQDWMQGVKEASVGNGIKAQRLRDWAIEWEQFCLWVVEEYGDEGGAEELARETHFDALD